MQAKSNTKMMAGGHHDFEEVASRCHETLSTFTSLHGKHNANAMWSRVLILNLPVEEAKMSMSSTTHDNNGGPVA